uniref:methionine adenosyltransferase n=1 Tax=viral metagenome TaxID=1070528 RepID=A0A6C0E8Y3_9ZZZZ
MANTFLFTSESVNDGHPDKICDQIVDAILDACIKEDEKSRVSCNCCIKSGMVFLFGEITTKARVNYEQIVRETIKEIGYDDGSKGFDYKTCNVVVAIEEQSQDISQCIDSDSIEDLGAGDQGIMFGYATNETEEMIPLSHLLALKLTAKLTTIRKDGTPSFSWLRPDAKVQVTFEYEIEDGVVVPVRVHTIVISTQHDDKVTNKQIKSDLLEHVVKPVVDAKYIDARTIFHFNPSGRFITGGPDGDTGISGRQMNVDTYGSWVSQGSGSFSGKDMTKIERSGSYAARWIAKSLVAANLCKRVLVQVSYAIGVSTPLCLYVDTYGTGSVSDKEMLDIINQNFDLRPGCIIRDLKLLRPIMKKTSVQGHFGRVDDDFTWEIPKPIVL